MPLSVYIENIASRDPAYRISERMVSEALSELVELSFVVEHDRSDMHANDLQRCDLLIGSSFDVTQIRRYGGALKMIHCTSAGVESLLPLDWLPQGCILVNSSGAHADKAGEFGLLALLMLNDKIPQHATSQRARRWRRTLSTPIKDKRVLIYGVGALGGAVAEKAKLLGLTVWGIRRSGKDHTLLDRQFLPEQLDEVIGEVDFLVVTAPLTTATRGAIGKPQIDKMKASAGLINMARAAIVDYPALTSALREGRLSGAVLDVFDQEPLPSQSPLWNVPNLSIIPHVSSDSPIDYAKKSLDILTENVRRRLRNEPLINVVNNELGY